jgi:flagellar protein FliO/FliZ
MVGQTLFVVVLFVAMLAMLPLAIKWIQRRANGGIAAAGNASRLVSVLPLGPQQRVVTVEVGPEGERKWLVLGVTGQSITCLHTAAVPTAAHSAYAVVASSVQDGGGHG